MDVVDMFETFIHLVKPGESVPVHEFRKRMAKAYDVVNGDQRTRYVYEQLATIPKTFAFRRKQNER